MASVATKEKLYYKIGEACKILDIQPYVLRYWETEFTALEPSKSKSGQRVYGEEDFELIRRIKELLYDEGFTIAGAKKKLESEMADGGVKTASRKSSAKASSGKQQAADDGTAVELASVREGVGKALEQAKELLDLLDG